MKENNKKIKAQLTNELSRKFERRITEANERSDYWKNKFVESENKRHELRKEISEIKEEKEQLQIELNQYKEWIDRMQEFCNLPEEERTEAVRTYITEKQSSIAANRAFEKLSSMMNMYTSLLF